MNLRSIFLFLLLLGTVQTLRAQTMLSGLKLVDPQIQFRQNLSSFSLQSGTIPSFFSEFQLPSHVRSNPRGYSPLCRLELKIEDQLPVGMWVKLGQQPLTPANFRTNADVRFKVLKF